MNREQLTRLVIIPTLMEIPLGYSLEAVTAIQMIIAHESQRGCYLKQVKGPARGIIMMEQETYNDVWRHGDSIEKNALLMGIFDQGIPPFKRLDYDLRFNVFMARQKLFMTPGALPLHDFEMAKYLKKHWNGCGKATATKYHYDLSIWK